MAERLRALFLNHSIISSLCLVGVRIHIMSTTWFVIGENVWPVALLGKEKWRKQATSKQQLWSNLMFD